MPSIRQNPTHPLPDWRNFGVVLRVLLGVNLLGALAALIQPGGVGGWVDRYVVLTASLEPMLFCVLGILALARDPLWRLPPRAGQVAVLVIAILVSVAQYRFWTSLGLTEGDPHGDLQMAILSAVAAALMLAYLDLRARAHSPAVAEARLMALNARIRPHFLFNSINAVLSLIRAEPRRAESALETISDLFRAALRDPADWLPLSEEIALCRQYLELEKLRLGDRLHVEWEIRDVPLDAELPPLMLQPLVENAVYHGAELAPENGVIHIIFERQGDELRMEVTNPIGGATRQTAGNHMALANIRERLSLYYDLEARLEIEATDNLYRVRICLPCRIKRDRSPS
ncbi:MAG: sensor histidine kinase [Betaproteobacteria bacterium]